MALQASYNHCMRTEPRKAILLVDHGSRLAEANNLLAEIAKLVEQSGPEYIVQQAHMELAEPTIAQGFDACVLAGALEVTVHPYMLGPGRHATQDIPRLVAAAALRHPGIVYRVTGPLGVHEGLASAVLDRVRESESNAEQSAQEELEDKARLAGQRQRKYGANPEGARVANTTETD